METVIINEKKIPWLIVERGFKIPSFNFESEIGEIPNRPGGVPKSRQLKYYEFDLPLIALNDYIYKRKSHDEILNELVRFFNYKEPVKLQLSTKDWYWNAMFDGPIELDSVREGFISFTIKVKLADPYKYAAVGNKNTAINDELSVVTEGTAPIKPHFTMTALKDTSYLYIGTDDKEYLAFGKPQVVGHSNKDLTPRILFHKMGGLGGWNYLTSGTYLDDNRAGGLVGGKLGPNLSGGHLQAITYGENEKGWYGPAVKQDFDHSLTDWYIIGTMKVFDRQVGVGKGFYHLLDESNKLVASIGLYNDTETRNNTRVIVQVYDDYGNSKLLFDYAGWRVGNYHDKQIFIKLTKKGNQYSWQTWRYYTDADGKRKKDTRIGRKMVFNDEGKQYQRPVRQVVASCMRYQGKKVLPVYLSQLSITELLDGEGYDYFIKKGDEITINNDEEIAYVNGEPIKQHKDWASNYLEVDKYHQEFVIMPPATFDTTAEWQDRYL